MTKKTTKKAETTATEPGEDWVKDQVGKTTVLTKRKNRTPTADTTTIAVMPVVEDRAPRAAFGTVPELPRPPIATERRTTLQAIAAGWLDHMRELGKTPATVASYEGDLQIAMAVLGAETDAATLTAAQIAAYADCDAVTKTKSGKPKAQPTILKTRRALRLALTWAAETGLIPAASKPADS